MKKETKENVQIFSAVGMLIFGAFLSTVGFFTDPQGEIHDSVLWIFAQCLIYAGSIFGIGIYINGKFGQLIDHMRNNEGKNEKN